MSNKELLEILKTDYYKVNANGVLDYMKKRDKRIPCLPNLQKRFNGKTFNEILLEAGVKDDDLNYVRRNKEEYLRKMQSIINEIGYVPSQNMLIKLGYSPSMLISLCGSWGEMLKELGYEYYSDDLTKVVETNEELLEQYVNFSAKLGRAATYYDLQNSDEMYNPGVYSIRFGGLNALKIEAGFEIIDNHNAKYTKKNIKDKLLIKRLRLKRRLTITDIKNDDELPADATILKYFKTTKITDVINEIEEIIGRIYDVI